jgi:DNA-binding MarR family transcriptional regulator
MRDELVFEIQRLYPQIYVACHVGHVRAGTTRFKLSANSSSILAHLSARKGTSPRALAGHLGVAPSTLSAAIKRLAQLGYIANTPKVSDRRQRELWLTELGAEAMHATSVLDAERVGQMLDKLLPREQKAAVRGLELLARAARQLEDSK